MLIALVCVCTVLDLKINILLRVRCFKVVGSLLSNQNTGMSENTTQIFIPLDAVIPHKTPQQAQQGL